MIISSNSVSVKVYLTETEKTLLKIYDYLIDNKHGLGGSGDLDNLLMDSQISSTLESLLKKVNYDTNATYYLKVVI